MTADRMIYARKAMLSIPRLLSNQDRNPYSPTYGCFHRDYWLDKTSDFPDAVRQFAVHALALVYSHDFEGNIYYQNERIRDWAIAGLDYWAGIQHSDGSFDEFYPYERGWVGPSAFTTYTSIESYNLLHEDMPVAVADRVRGAIRKATQFIGKGENEADYLANHHAMACLTLWKAWDLLGESRIKRDYESAWKTFLTYHNEREGWSREYDGVDPGYLSATVSFLGKIYKMNPDPAIKRVLEKAVEFSAYFVYPNGFYAGSTGSRNTLHFYPHGYEILADEIPLAGKIAETMLQALGEDKLVPPEIISDRYVVYRVPEFLLAFIDHKDRVDDLPPLPYEREPFRTHFPESQILIETTDQHYTVVNLAKGGIIKHFDRHTGELLNNDAGIIGELNDGSVVTSQWINPDYEIDVTDTGWSVSGKMNRVPSTKLFNPFKHILFRAALIAVGWNSFAAHLLKGQIRRTLILGQRPVDVRFERTVTPDDSGDVVLSDTLLIDNHELTFESLQFGGEFFVRYVPQSRYFQSQELHVNSQKLNSAELNEINSNRHITIRRALTNPIVAADVDTEAAANKVLPEGVYTAEYHAGRLKKRQLIYRLQRRTDEVLRAIETYGRGDVNLVFDAGTADSLMLEKISYRYPYATYIGLDYSMGLLRSTEFQHIHKVQGDVQNLPMPDNSADVVIATAIIEHVPDPAGMMTECRRVLRDEGLLIITTPQPTMEKIASAIGLLKESGHQETFNLDELSALSRNAGFTVVEAKKFMFSPVGFPQEKQIERIFGPLGLNLVMANQLVVCQK